MLTMKTLTMSGAALMAAIGLGSTALAAPLTVELSGVRAGGTLYISVQAEADFMQQRGVAGERIESPSAGDHSFTFDLPEGAYAISVWHDEDNNGVFDRAERGWPLDGWAMSGPALTGPPEFDDVAIEVGSRGAEARLIVTYPSDS